MSALRRPVRTEDGRLAAVLEHLGPGRARIPGVGAGALATPLPNSDEVGRHRAAVRRWKAAKAAEAAA